MKMTADKDKDKGTAGEQLDLLDITPEYAKPIKAAAKAYKKLVIERSALSIEEAKLKKKVIDAVRAAKIKPDPATGIIEFRLEGVTIKITPRDEELRIKLDDNES
jgi:hypothetical protein